MDSPITKEMATIASNQDSYNLNVFNAFMANTSNKSFGHGQEDAGEFIVLLFDLIFKSNPFMYTYNCSLFCMNCRKSEEVSQDRNLFFYTSLRNIQECTIDNKLPDPSLVKFMKNNFSKCYGTACKQCGCGKMVKVNRIDEVAELLFVSLHPDTDKKEKCPYPSYAHFDSGNDRHIYRLISVIYHSGTKESGHYYARCLRNSWFEFNDLQVTPCSYPEPEANAYLLLYEYQRTDEDAARPCV